MAVRDGHGHLARAAVNTDAVLLSVLVEAQQDHPLPRAEVGPCALRAGRGASVVLPGSPPTVQAGALSLLAASAVVADHVADGDGLAGRLPAPSAWVARRWERAGRSAARAVGLDPEPVLGAAARSADLERQVGLGVEEWSAPTEDALGLVCRHTAVLAGVPANEEPLERVGRMLGRIVHLLDALTDLEADLAAGQFNPLIAADPGGDRRTRTELGAATVVAAHGQLVGALAEAHLPQGELVRALLVDQLGRTITRIIGRVSEPDGACGSAGGRRAGGTGRTGRGGPLGAVAAFTSVLGGVVAMTPALFGRRSKRRAADAAEDAGECACDCCCEGCDCCDCCDGCDC